MNTETNTTETLPNFWPKECIGLPVDVILSLNAEARALYDKIYDYCTYSADPQYQILHKYRNQIDRLANAADREILISYFNQDPAIRFQGMHGEPFEYYAEPY
jgi:hypothetical protein